MDSVTNKKFRTPLIKPRKQGGTFYTFGSALEDIGMNINNTSNKVEISHYILLDLPAFSKDTLGTHGEYTSGNIGDTIFAEYFQDAVLNMETVIRNNSDYEYTSPKTVSEAVFWKNVLKNATIGQVSDKNGGTYYYEDADEPIAKAFGRIVSGSQRSDAYGIYNETFVQIPSSYGQMRVFLRPANSTNCTEGKEYKSSNEGIVEGVSLEEYNPSTHILNSTGISAEGIFDDSNNSYTSDKYYNAELDITRLRKYYENQELTYDTIGFGITDASIADHPMHNTFMFNAILVYYTIYDSTGTSELATNAFGVYILNSAMNVSADDSGVYKFPELTKRKTTDTEAGTSFSFRLNIKPTSAYNGDITVLDNSSTAFSESTDFNDIIKNLSLAVETLKTNAQTLSSMSVENQNIKSLAVEAMAKVNNLADIVSNLQMTNIYDTIGANEVMIKTFGTLTSTISPSVARDILDNISVTYDQTGNVSMTVDTSKLSGDALAIAKTLTTKVGDDTYIDDSKLVALMVAGRKSTN